MQIIIRTVVFTDESGMLSKDTELASISRELECKEIEKNTQKVIAIKELVNEMSAKLKNVADKI